jgi:Flp pilus assembly protein TadD
LTARPREVVLYHTLGQLLTGQEPPRWAEAVECYAAARALRPDLGVNLAAALRQSGRWPEALSLLAWLVKERPDNPYLHHKQAYALAVMGDLDGAIVCWKKALELDPKHSEPYYNLGTALCHKHDLDGAIACFQKALELDPKHAEAHNNLGTALYHKHDLDGAIAYFQKALELDPKCAEAHGAMGKALLQQGRYAAARESTRRALELLGADASHRRVALQQRQLCEYMLTLDQKLPDILTGKASPANPSEAVSFAQMCQQPYQKRYAPSARLYADAFTSDRRFADDLNQQHRYNAACSAALAAAGQGEDAPSLPDKVRSMFRRWALRWLRDDLSAYSRLVGESNPAANKTIQQRLAHWRRDADLASVRDSQALDRLPDNERAAWQALWRDVDKLAKQAAKTDEPTKVRKELGTPKTEPESRSLPPSGAKGR